MFCPLTRLNSPSLANLKLKESLNPPKAFSIKAPIAC